MSRLQGLSGRGSSSLVSNHQQFSTTGSRYYFKYFITLRYILHLLARVVPDVVFVHRPQLARDCLSFIYRRTRFIDNDCPKHLGTNGPKTSAMSQQPQKTEV